MTILDLAKIDLAEAMLNQVGVTWEEACDSVDAFIANRPQMSDAEMINLLRCEAYHYADM